MTKSKSDSRGFGAQGLTFGVPAPSLEGVPEAVWPFVKTGMKVQSEFLGLVGHRMCAWLDWPDKVCACRTTDDLITEQSNYLTRMQHDYAHFLDGVLPGTMIKQDEIDEEPENDGEDDSAASQSEVSHREAA